MPTVPHVVIGIATYRRPAGLRRLLTSLDNQTFDDGMRPKLTLVVIDNDAQTTLTVDDRASLHPLMYRIETEKGLATVRNACLDAAPADADFIAFIDDDEWAEPSWLGRLLAMQATTGADIVQGVVRPAYTVPAPTWMREGGYHEVGPFTDGAPLNHGASGNVLIRRTTIATADARFRIDFNRSGGEDVDFFDQLLRSGAHMVAANGAVAHEDIPHDRMTLRWIVQRRYRTGHTLGLIARHRGGRLLRTLKALARMSAGAAQTVFGLVTTRTRAVRGITNMAWGAGTLAALFGPEQQSSINHY